MDYLIGILVGVPVGYACSLFVLHLAEQKQLEAKRKRSEAAKKGRAKKVVDLGKTDPSMYGRKVNGSGMVDHE